MKNIKLTKAKPSKSCIFEEMIHYCVVQTKKVFETF